MQPDEYIMVVGVDFSDESAFAVDCAIRLAATGDKAFIHAIHVTPVANASHWAVPPDTLSANELANAWSTQSQLLERLARYCDERWQALENGPRAKRSQIRVHVREGHAADEIVHTAEQSGAGLIVVGTHGRRGVRRLILGSVAEEVVRCAPCPVFVARRLTSSRKVLRRAHSESDRPIKRAG